MENKEMDTKVKINLKWLVAFIVLRMLFGDAKGV